MSITDTTDPNLSRYLVRKNGKLLMFHGWADPEGQAEPTLDYYLQVIEATFRNDVNAAQEKVRFFLFPGMGHCRDGPGCNEADPFKALVRGSRKPLRRITRRPTPQERDGRQPATRLRLSTEGDLSRPGRWTK